LYMFLSRGVDYSPLFRLDIPFLRMVDYMYDERMLLTE
jgi:hypothetical protein